MTRTFVVIMNGQPESGKDTFVNMCAEYCDTCEVANVVNVSSVEPLKDLLTSIGWDGKKTTEVRKMLADLKQFWVSNQNGPTQFLLNNIFGMHSTYVNNDNIFFTHIREPEEIGKLLNKIDAMNDIGIYGITTFITRGKQEEAPDIAYADSLENIVNFSYDVIVDNTGSLDDLRAQATQFIDKLLEE